MVEVLIRFEELDEGAAKVERHDLVGGSDKLAADEDGGNHRISAAHRHQRLLDILAFGVEVDVVHARLHPEFLEQDVHGVAEATCGFAEDEDAVVGRQPPHLVHFCYVLRSLLHSDSRRNDDDEEIVSRTRPPDQITLI